LLLWAPWSKETAPDEGGGPSPGPGAASGSLGLGTAPDAASVEFATIAGKVVDQRDQGLAKASVWAVDDRGRLREAWSGPSGEFELRDLPPGAYRLAAQLDAQTCEPVGPLPLAPGDEVRGIVLKLAPGAHLSGRVLDLRSQAPLPGAQIAILATPLVTTADAHGHFDLPAVLPGGHEIRVSAARHVTRSVPMTFGQGTKVAGLDIFLQPAATVVGRVVGGDGTGISGASLFIARYRASRSEDGAPPLAQLPTHTSDNGEFSLDLEAGSAQIIARFRGLAEGQSGMLDLLEGQEQKVEIVLRAGGQVIGSVQGADGRPVNGGRVAVFSGSDPNNGWMVGEAPVHPNGRFEVDALPKGHLLVSAEAQGARASGSVDLEEGGTAQLELKLGNGTLSGKVTDGHGAPVPNARLQALAVGAGVAGEQSAVSDSAGRFRLSGLAGERFDVSATKDEGSAQLRGVAAGREDLVLVLSSGAISGFVVTPDGSSVTDFYLAVEPDLPGQGHVRSSHVVDPRGEFRLPVAPGTYLVRASAPGYAEGRNSVPVRVDDGQESGGVRVELRPSGSITGLVVDADNGAPLAGVHVATDLAHVWAVGRTEPLGSSVAVSGLDGRFQLRDVPPGNWPVRAQSSTHEPIGPPPFVTVVAGQSPPDVQIRLRRSESRDQAYAGIGMSLFERDGHKYAGEVFEGGPARAAGVRQGDLIVAIDGHAADPISLGDLVGLIRGPSGSEVTLDMQRGQGQSYSVVVPRAEIRF
jgi:hypothetical protein